MIANTLKTAKSMVNFFKPGDKVRFTGDTDIYIVHTVYSRSQVSLGLLDYPDTEQDQLTDINQLCYVNDVL